MRIHGFNKLTLLDYPGHMACTIFTGSCNLRCPFCHNASLVLHPDSQPLLDTSEILHILKDRRKILEGVCITGGEPTLQSDLFEFITSIKEMGYLVKLDTNGTNPDLLEKLYKAGKLDCVAMDIKSSKENYSTVCDTANIPIDKIEQSVKLIMNSGVDYEFRTTVVQELHKCEDFKQIAEWLKGAKKYYLQQFEDSGDLIGSGYHSVDKEHLKEYQDILNMTIESVEIRG